MTKKVYTIDVEDKNLKTTAKSKAVKTVKSKAEKEVENFGIVEINNAGATKKLSNKVDKGFEKNVVGTAKKSVKQKVNEVEDYFDFSFRTEAPKAEKKVAEKKTTAKKTATKKAVKTTKVEAKVEVVSERLEEVKEACKVNTYDAEAYIIMNLARMGSLFDCDKRMINA